MPSQGASAGSCLLLAVVMALAPRVVLAQERETATLSYSVPEGSECPDERQFRDIVASRLGYDAFVEQAPIDVRAVIEHQGAELTSTVSAERGEVPLGERRGHGRVDDCASLVESMALSISILLDPLGVGVSEPNAPREDDPVAPTTHDRDPEHETRVPPSATGEQPADDPAREAQQAPKPEDTIQPDKSSGSFVLELGGQVDAGLAPEWSTGFHAGSGLLFEPFTLLLTARGDFMPAQARTSQGDLLSVTQWTAGPAACFGVSPAVACAEGQVGVFVGESPTVPDGERQATFLAVIGLRAGVDLAVSRALGFRLFAEMRVPCVRTELQIDDVPVWRAPAVAGGLGLSLLTPGKT